VLHRGLSLNSGHSPFNRWERIIFPTSNRWATYRFLENRKATANSRIWIQQTVNHKSVLCQQSAQAELEVGVANSYSPSHTWPTTTSQSFLNTEKQCGNLLLVKLRERMMVCLLDIFICLFILTLFLLSSFGSTSSFWPGTGGRYSSASISTTLAFCISTCSWSRR